MADENSGRSRPTYTAEPLRADTDSAVFMGNAHIDNLMTVVIAIGAEIWTDRQRLRIVERLLETTGKVTRETIEQYIPSEEERRLWESEAMVRRVYAVLSRDTSGAKPFASERQ